MKINVFFFKVVKTNSKKGKVGKAKKELLFFYFIFFNWDSIHARLNSHYEAWGYKKKKKTKAYRKYATVKELKNIC